MEKALVGISAWGVIKPHACPGSRTSSARCPNITCGLHEAHDSITKSRYRSFPYGFQPLRFLERVRRVLPFFKSSKTLFSVRMCFLDGKNYITRVAERKNALIVRHAVDCTVYDVNLHGRSRRSRHTHDYYYFYFFNRTLTTVTGVADEVFRRSHL